MERRFDRTGITVYTSQDNRTKTRPSMGGLWAKEAYLQKRQDPQKVEENWQRRALHCFPGTKETSPRQTKKTVLGPRGHPDYRRNSYSRSTPTYQEVLGLHKARENRQPRNFPTERRRQSWSQVMRRKLNYWTGNSSQPSAQRNNSLKRNLQQGAPCLSLIQLVPCVKTSTSLSVELRNS